MRLSNSELKAIVGGAAISSSLINSLLKGANIFMDMGRYLGSSVRRIIEKRMCSL